MADRDVVASDFFAPVDADKVDGLMGEYAEARAAVEALSDFAVGRMPAALDYFIKGNRKGGTYMPSATELLRKPVALAALNADFWDRAIKLTDVMDHMPQVRRTEWNEAIREHKTPEFTPEIVRATITELLHSRSKFLAERVDGIFRALSGDHVTNVPEGFGRRMILAGLVSQWGSSTDRVGYINDLRCVIAKFMGRDEPKYGESDSMVKHAREVHRGEWLPVDGNAFRIRCYKGGTAHLEVHPEMAYRLNGVIAMLYPTAIPPQFRTKPKKASREFAPMQRPLPAAVVALLARMRQATRPVEGCWRGSRENVPKTLEFERRYDADPAALAEAERVLASLGGVRSRSGWQFSFDAAELVAEVAHRGCVPDKVSHQFYPTPPEVADLVIQQAKVGPDDTVLEPSAGHGALAERLPAARTTCVEISELHCAILAARGFNVECADFLKWALAQPQRYDRIVMNPPFADGRAQLHLYAARELLKPSGRLVCVLPASMIGDTAPVRWHYDWQPRIENAFAGVSVAVTILVATRLTP